jgi:hypothetical protein
VVQVGKYVVDKVGDEVDIKETCSWIGLVALLTRRPG